jgi:hypothetical protein
VKLVVTVDTEADNQWSFGCPISIRNTQWLPPFQVLCSRHGFRPTYLVSWEVANDEESTALMRPWREQGEAGIGAHLHPWTTPPFLDEPDRRFNDSAHVFPSELEPSLLEAKLIRLTDEITTAFGERPTSFRAGRFGIDSNCGGMLEALGYEVDSSVTPGISWRRVVGEASSCYGPSFVDAPLHPYHPSAEDISRLGAMTLLEVPLTILHSNLLSIRLESTAARVGKLAKVPLERLRRVIWPRMQPLWLRPFPWMTRDRMLYVWEAAERLGLPLAVMMFHSSELMPGASPYRPTLQSVQELLTVLDGFFAALSDRGVEGLTLSEVALTRWPIGT